MYTNSHSVILLFFYLLCTSYSSSSRDVDMRFLPSVVGTISAASILNPTDQTNTASPTIKETSTIGSLGMDKDVTMSSNSNSSSGVITVDYSQYLKDSNLSFDKGDLCKI